MIRYLIKNNFKLMFRNTWSIVVMLLGPILVIGALNGAFTELMKSYKGVDEFAVGYRMESDSPLAATIESVKMAGEEAGITFYEYQKGTPKDVIENNNLVGFVEFGKDEYILYKSADYEVEGVAFEYFLGQVMSEGAYASFRGANQTTDMVVKLPTQKLEFMPAVDAGDYYGIVFIVYFCWCGMICATGVLSNEKKYGIQRKFQVSNASEFSLYLAKLVPVTLTVVVGMGISTIASIWIYDIHWGKPLMSAVIVLVMIVAANAFGMMLYNIFDSLAITIIALFTVVWFMGMFGGCFETYMFSSLADNIKHLSPIYHGNRALVELSCMGTSEYVDSAIIYSLAIAAVCSVIAVLASGIRKRGRA